MTSPKYDEPDNSLFNFFKIYFCSTVTTQDRIEMKTKEIHFSLFYFHFNYIVNHPDAAALARDKQYGGNSDGNREMVKTGFSYSNFRFFFSRE